MQFKYFLYVIFIVNSLQAFDKWIVVTTIQYPTSALEKLAKLPGWKLVVVGDKKTPSDWYLEGCDYLGVEDQLALGYEITNVIPWNHYARKNIGYLYALEHGAQVIYETDDDNYIDTDIQLLEAQLELEVFSCKKGTLNPYALFGHTDVWPRGYPLEAITLKDVCDIEKKNANILIQQGLINGDTDVDAIFRLTRATNVYFNKRAPVALERGVMAPFNSQNTVMYYDAFWALLIPMSVTFRVCDIWRGYIMQRLLWDIDGHLAFFSTDVVQNRNEHNLLNDFKDEIDLYTKSGAFIKFLTEWKSSEKNLFNRIDQLFTAAIEKQFFMQKEQQLVQAWLNDLNRLGYKQPVVQ